MSATYSEFAAKWLDEYGVFLEKSIADEERQRDWCEKEAKQAAQSARVDAARARRQKQLATAYEAVAASNRALLAALKAGDRDAAELAEARSKVARDDLICLLRKESKR